MNANPSRGRAPGRAPGLTASWRRLSLWPRLVLGVTLGFALVFAGFSVVGIRAVDESTSRILQERLAITEMLAQDFDGLLEHDFSDLEAFDPGAQARGDERVLLDEIYQHGRGEFASVSLLDRSGSVVATLGEGGPPAHAALAAKPYVARVLRGSGRSISAPYRDRGGRAVVALAVAVRTGALVGTLDLGGSAVVRRLDSARRLGRTGHAELVGPGGIALASTEFDDILAPGEHVAFYREMLARRTPGTGDVLHNATGSMGGREDERHEMAFARLSTAPWGVALGGTDSETFAPARRLRRTLLLGGTSSLAVLWLLTLLGARLLVRPVRELTRAAEEMASGDLERPVRVSEGGEIGVLGESLETMRAQLRDSLETVRRWGAELEVKVGERTAELNARNRQLAAVSAIMAAANETHDLEPMLERCLDLVLEETGAEAASVRLVDDEDGTCVARGSSADDSARVMPLQGPSGVVGELTLSGRAATPEPAVLAAICDQIAVAIENARLAAELRRLEARHEVQRLRSELISAVSHELRTPLGFIKSYATTLLREDTPIATETRRKFLATIDEETDKLEHMIDELLDASRLQAGRLPIEREPVELGALIGRAVEKAGPALAEGHRVELRLPGDDALVLADALRIEQVLDNLLENAARYSEPGSSIGLDLAVEEGYALVGVTNRGEGIAEPELEQVFEPFYRGRSSKQRGVRGAGLGLAISRGIVEAHGGRIWAESVPGKATTFLVSLPLADPALAPV